LTKMKLQDRWKQPMNKENYEQMLLILQRCYGDSFDSRETVIISWSNGLKVKCKPFLGMEESDTEPGDEDYIGEYYTVVDEVEIIENGSNDSISIENNGIVINIHTVPEKIEKLDGTLLWNNPSRR